MTRTPPSVDRRTALKGLAGGLTAVTGAGVLGTAAASHSVTLTCYVYLDSRPAGENVPERYHRDLDVMAWDAADGLETVLADVVNSGHCDMSYDVSGRYQQQRDDDAYPNLDAGDIGGFRDWLDDQGYTEGSQQGTAAIHHLVRHDDSVNGGGKSSGNCWPAASGAIPVSMSTAASPGDWNRLTVQHEVGHAMVDSSLPEVRDMTHASASECPHADSNETIHHREHTLGTVVDGGKTVMAHRSPTAADCTGGGNGSGVGGDNGFGTGISPGRTSHAADKAFGISKRHHS